MAAVKKASFWAVLRDRLGVLYPERYANSLSERRSLSGAWESSDLLYKLFLLSNHRLNDLQLGESLQSVLLGDKHYRSGLGNLEDCRLSTSLPGWST
jgi:hypothetical protein